MAEEPEKQPQHLEGALDGTEIKIEPQASSSLQLQSQLEVS